MAEVFRAESQPVAGVTRTVAIKRILHGTGETDASLGRMFADEARIWVRLQHPNIVQVLDFGEHEGALFLALELIDGMSAAELVRDAGALPVIEALCIAGHVARALDHAHSLEAEDGTPLQIVHRDVKPGNILLSTRGEVKLTDFGIARATNRVTRTVTGMVRGSLSTMAPEQARGEPLDGRADLFALGAVLHALLTGKPLIALPEQQALEALALGKIPALPETLPANVRRLMARLVAPDRRDRPATAGEVARELRTMMLPASPEDVERELGARVSRVRALPDPAAGRPSELTLVFSAARGSVTRGVRAVASRPPLLLMCAFAAALTVIAILAIGPAMSSVGKLSCDASRTAIEQVLRTRGAGEAANGIDAFALRCPKEAAASHLRVRLLTLAGRTREARAALPPPATRDDDARWAAAAIDFSEGDYRRAELAAATIARAADSPPRAADARCLAAAAALNQDHPERVEGHLGTTPPPCARVLRAAALAQSGERGAALAQLRAAEPAPELGAARESAHAVLHLFAGDMEAAASSALSATGESSLAGIAPRPWIWHTVPSPRGADSTALRVSGPFDDPWFHTKLLEGDAARVRGNLDLAIKRYDEAIARGGRSAIADVRAAAVLAQQGRPQLARGRLTRAVAKDARCAPALVALAKLEEKDDLRSAIAHANAALALEPENRDARRIAGKSVAREK